MGFPDAGLSTALPLVMLPLQHLTGLVTGWSLSSCSGTQKAAVWGEDVAPRVDHTAHAFFLAVRELTGRALLYRVLLGFGHTALEICWSNRPILGGEKPGEPGQHPRQSSLNRKTQGSQENPLPRQKQSTQRQSW